MRLAFRSCLRPTAAQRQSLRQHAGNARWAYNWGLAQHNIAYQQWVELGKPQKWDGWPNATSLHRDLNKLKKLPVENGGVPWMYEASKASPQEALRDLDGAFSKFFRGLAKYPKFKSKNRGIGGFRLSGAVKTTSDHAQLPRIGKVRLMPHERGYLPEGPHSQISVREQAGRWFVSVVGPEVAEAPNNGGSAVGLDLGVAVLATLSDGTTYENPRPMARCQRSLKHLQRSLARKKKGSANRMKAKAKVAKAHMRIKCLRSDNLHKVTTILAKSHSKVVIEDLKVTNMTKGGGSRKRGLNRVLADASFGEFRRLLEYKGKLYGCEIIRVNPAYTSQRCNLCKHTEKGNRASQALFRCLKCGHEDNADLNAAKNILELGLEMVAASSTETQNACGGEVRPDPTFGLVTAASVKQEPLSRAS